MKKFAAILTLALTTLAANAHPGVGIVEDRQGNVYYTDLKQVWKITPSGRKTIVVPAVHTHELFLDENDFLYGEHLWYNGDQRNTWGHYVWRLSPAGKVDKVIPDTEGFLENYSFVRDHLGNMYWADRSKDCQTVVRRGSDNTTKSISNQCFENIRKVETLPDGSVYLVDFQDLKKIDVNGKVSTIAAKIANKRWTKSTVENQNSVMGIWSDNKGNLYAAVLSERLVKRFGPDGKEEVAYKTAWPWAPSGGMVDSKGNLWLLETSKTNDVRVERVGPDGRSVTF